MKNKWDSYIKNQVMECKDILLQQSPLVHCMTNPVTMQDMANMLSGIGASPLMSMHRKEILEVNEIRDAFLCNLGANFVFDEMLESANLAKRKQIPVVLDPVGVSFSSYRRKQAMDLLDTGAITYLKGNMSEILTLVTKQAVGRGVDAIKVHNINTDSEVDRVWLQELKRFAKVHHLVIVATGETDMLTDGEHIALVKNGTALLQRVTGSGCLLGALLATYAFAMAKTTTSTVIKEENLSDSLLAAILACVHSGISSQLAESEMQKKHLGMIAFKMKWLDLVLNLNRNDLHECEANVKLCS